MRSPPDRITFTLPRDEALNSNIFRDGTVDHLFGLSTQDTAYQREAAERLHLPFPILSDKHLELSRAMRLPTFEAGGMTLLKRLTLVIRDGMIEHVFYPVFPPDRNASQVVEWLTAQTQPSPPLKA